MLAPLINQQQGGLELQAAKAQTSNTGNGPRYTPLSKAHSGKLLTL